MAQDVTFTNMLMIPQSQIIGHSSSTSHMHEYLDNLLLWTQENDMKINISKTKELLMGHWGWCDITPLQTISGIIEIVSEIKLLGVYIDSSLTQNKHTLSGRPY